MRPVRVVLALLLAAALGALTIAPAQAAAYRYWGFYGLTDGAWTYMQKGPDQTVPKDGTVEGWRFAVGESDPRLPRAVLTFDELCAATPAASGTKRVGLVVDFGRPADAEEGATPPAPMATCAAVPTTATSTDVLRAAGELRMDKGLICGVAGYPATGCGGEVKQVSAEAKAPDTAVSIAAPTPSSSSTPNAAATDQAAPSPTAAAESGSGAGTTIAYVVAALALLALIAYLVMRSRSAARRDRG